MIYTWFLLVDLPLALLRVIVVLLGPFVVTLALPFSRNNKLPRIAAWWDNPDYGIKGNHAYLTQKAYNPLVKYAGRFPSNWYWLVVRNPANGLTESRMFSVSQADCDYVRHKGNERVDNYLPGWQFVYAKQGWRMYTGFYWFKGRGEYRFGFKLLPHEPGRHRRVGMTFIPNPFKRT
ncbi:DUF7338 family protein [Marinobacter sp. MCTG268]|uniref:DUF7338 family protein n=1 Tax=Marinobacter adhaerens TaxID=1033846 RepID=UPI00055A89D5